MKGLVRLPMKSTQTKSTEQLKRTGKTGYTGPNDFRDKCIVDFGIYLSFKNQVHGNV